MRYNSIPAGIIAVSNYLGRWCCKGKEWNNDMPFVSSLYLISS